MVWENWIEQAQMYPTDPSNGLVVPNAAAAGSSAVHLLHGSPLALLKNATLSTVVPGLLGEPTRIVTRHVLRQTVSPT